VFFFILLVDLPPSETPHDDEDSDDEQLLVLPFSRFTFSFEAIIHPLASKLILSSK
jgi:hypothetical protein